MNDLSNAVDQLIQSVESLERRVSALERAGDRQAVPLLTAEGGSVAMAGNPGLQGSGLFSVVGRAMLVVAGAYLLRAFGESSGEVRKTVVTIAIVYAVLWLIPAARAKGRAARIAWACTAAVVLLPMLWELTVRLDSLRAGIVAGVLAAFVVAGLAFSWKSRCAEAASVAGAAGSLGALVLALATHNLLPFLGALLLMMTTAEIAAACRWRLGVRWIVAASADFLVFALIWIYAGPAGGQTIYPPIGTTALLTGPLALLGLSAAGACTQTLVLRRPISFAETAQAMAAFLLALIGVEAFSPASGAPWLGMLCLISAAGGYALAFGVFARRPGARNFHVYATGSLLLLLVGGWLRLTPAAVQVVLAAAAMVASFASLRTRSLTLGFHGFACLLASAVASRQLTWAAHVLADGFPTSSPRMVFFLSACSLLCYAAATRLPLDGRGPRLLRLLDGAVAVVATAALLIWMLARIADGEMAVAAHLALLRTLVACALALALAWSGARWRRPELVWLSWFALGYLASKLLFEDLRHGHLAFAAASIFLFAVTLLIVPRLQRAKIAREDGTPV